MLTHPEIPIEAGPRVAHDPLGKLPELQPEKLIQLHLHLPPLLDIVVQLQHHIAFALGILGAIMMVVGFADGSQVASYDLFPILDYFVWSVYLYLDFLVQVPETVDLAGEDLVDKGLQAAELFLLPAE